MKNYLKAVPGNKETSLMWFTGYLINIFAWTIGAAVFVLVADSFWSSEKEPWQTFFVSFIQFAPCLIAVLITTKLFGRKVLTVVTSEQKFSIRNLRFGILSWMAVLGTGTFISWAADPSALKYTFDISTFAPALLVLLLLLPIQVSAEELFFRGFIPQSLSRTSMSDSLVITISTLIFALPHLLNPEATSDPVWSLIAYSAMGFGWLMAAKWLGGLEVAIGAHLANNFFGLAIVGYENSVVESSSIWVGPEAQMQSSAIALWITVGIWLFIVKKLRVSKLNSVTEG